MALATFQVLGSHMWPVAALLDSIDREHFHLRRRSIGEPRLRATDQQEEEESLTMNSWTVLRKFEPLYCS